jgi:hypothetical protein
VTHDSTTRAQPGTLRHRILAASLAVTVAAGVLTGFASIGNAQDDGTGASTPPPPTTCLIVPATATSPTPEASPVASPDSDTATPVVDAATPAASPVMFFGTPAASPVIGEATPAADTPVDPLLDDLRSTTDALFGCLNERKFDTYAQITSDTWRGALFGSVEPLPAAQFVELAAILPDADHRILEISDVTFVDDSTVTARVTYVSAYQQRAGIWTFSREEVDGIQTWVLDREEPVAVAPPAGAATIAVTFTDNGYTVTPDSVSGSDVVLNLANPTADDHEALVLRLDEGIAPDILLQGAGSLPEGVTLVGQSTVLAGAEGTMTLTGLTPGAYTIVDLLPDATGTPNLANGMVATFTVTP